MPSPFSATTRTDWPPEAFAPLWLPPLDHVAPEPWPGARLEVREDLGRIVLGPSQRPSLLPVAASMLLCAACGAAITHLGALSVPGLLLAVLFVLSVGMVIWAGALA